MTRIPCVGAVVFDERGRLLLVRRANEPARGLWSLPGGRVEPGESAQQAVVREVREETGLDVEVDGTVGTIERDAPGGGVYVIEDFICRVSSSPAHISPGDDAADATWATRTDLDALPTSPGLVDVLTAWQCLPTAP